MHDLRRDAGECDHVKGRVYAGRFAGVLVDKEADLRETSLVDIPADKRCRVEQITTDGVTRDTLTWKVVSTPADCQEESGSDDPQEV